MEEVEKGREESGIKEAERADEESKFAVDTGRTGREEKSKQVEGPEESAQRENEGRKWGTRIEAGQRADRGRGRS